MVDKPRTGSRLTLILDWPEITLESLSRVASLWADLVQSVTTAAAGKRKAVKWVISSVKFGSPLVVESGPESGGKQIPPALMETIAHAVIDGMEHLESRHDQPEFFTSQTLSLARKLALQADVQQQRRIVVSNGKEQHVELSPRIVAAVSDIFGPVVESYGSIEGRLEGVFTHAKRRFYVYDSLTGRQVRCLFDDAVVPLSDVLGAYEKRVSISGSIRSKALTGEHLSIQAMELRVFDDDDRLPPTDTILRMWEHAQ